MRSVSADRCPPKTDTLRSQHLAALDLHIVRLRYGIAFAAYRDLIARNAEPNKKDRPLTAQELVEERRVSNNLHHARRELQAAVAMTSRWRRLN
jgi:hypothetical protein